MEEVVRNEKSLYKLVVSDFNAVIGMSLEKEFRTEKFRGLEPVSIEFLRVGG